MNKRGIKMNEVKKVAFCSLGCKVNQYETNAMAQKFIEHGYEVVEFDEYADVYIVNTCTVTNVADRKSRQMLRRAKEINKDATLVACGCYAQVAKDELKKIPDRNKIAEYAASKKPGEYLQFQRIGYFMADLDSTAEKPYSFPLP